MKSQIIIKSCQVLCGLSLPSIITPDQPRPATGTPGVPGVLLLLNFIYVVTALHPNAASNT
jgi:hypothetical protein